MSTVSLSEKAYDHIRNQVFTGKLAPGSRLVNRKLASELGTSFIPVREAISRLASEGVVEQVAGAGAFVREFDRQEISEIYDVRELFEPFAAAEAARLMTTHELSELKALLEGWQNLGDRILGKSRGASIRDMDQWLKINERFHEVMIAASRNRILSKITGEMHVLSQCFAVHRGSPELLSETLIKSTLTSHRKLFKSLEKGDSQTAEALVREALRYGRAAVLAFFDQNRHS